MTGRSRLRRVRRVVVGGVVAAVLIDRRRRQRDLLAQPRGTDPLTAFEGAPCYREGASKG